MTLWAPFWYSGTNMGFEVDIDVPRLLVHFFGHSAERLVVESLAPSADVIHGCLTDDGMSIFGELSVAKTHLAAFLTSMGADCIRINKRT
jgi:hypothetical protein